jgi:hypothetical protein
MIRHSSRALFRRTTASAESEDSASVSAFSASLRFSPLEARDLTDDYSEDGARRGNPATLLRAGGTQARST